MDSAKDIVSLFTNSLVPWIPRKAAMILCLSTTCRLYEVRCGYENIRKVGPLRLNHTKHELKLISNLKEGPANLLIGAQNYFNSISTLGIDQKW